MTPPHWSPENLLWEAFLREMPSMLTDDPSLDRSTIDGATNGANRLARRSAITPSLLDATAAESVIQQAEAVFAVNGNDSSTSDFGNETLSSLETVTESSSEPLSRSSSSVSSQSFTNGFGSGGSFTISGTRSDGSTVIRTVEDFVPGATSASAQGGVTNQVGGTTVNASVEIPGGGFPSTTDSTFQPPNVSGSEPDSVDSSMPDETEPTATEPIITEPVSSESTSPEPITGEVGTAVSPDFGTDPTDSSTPETSTSDSTEPVQVKPTMPDVSESTDSVVTVDSEEAADSEFTDPEPINEEPVEPASTELESTESEAVEPEPTDSVAVESEIVESQPSETEPTDSEATESGATQLGEAEPSSDSSESTGVELVSPESVSPESTDSEATETEPVIQPIDVTQPIESETAQPETEGPAITDPQESSESNEFSDNAGLNVDLNVDLLEPVPTAPEAEPTSSNTEVDPRGDSIVGLPSGVPLTGTGDSHAAADPLAPASVTGIEGQTATFQLDFRQANGEPSISANISLTYDFDGLATFLQDLASLLQNLGQFYERYQPRIETTDLSLGSQSHSARSAGTQSDSSAFTFGLNLSSHAFSSHTMSSSGVDSNIGNNC